MRTSSTLSMIRSLTVLFTTRTLTVLQRPPSSTFAFDPAASVVVAHTLRIADLLHVVHGNLQPLVQTPSARIAAGAPPRPLTVACDQNDGQIGDGGLRLDERLDPGALCDPLAHVREIGGGVAGACARSAASKPVEQSQLGR